MARSFGRIMLSIWGDPDWRDRTVDAQWLYQLLLSQNVSYAGILAVAPKRWSNLAAGMTAKRVGKALDELREHRYVVVDDVTDELLIRTFVRHDGVLEQPNVVKAMVKAYDQIISPQLRAEFLDQVHSIADEIARGDLDEPKSWQHAGVLLTTPYPKGYGPKVAELRSIGLASA